MYYDTLEKHRGSGDPGLPWNPFKALVAPRPIGWISTLSADGVVNVAPYSYFQAVNDGPDIVMFSASPWMYAKDGTTALSETVRKHSEVNARKTREFVCSLATWELREEMNATSANLSHELSEADQVGLRMAPSTRVRPPRVAAAPAALECVYLDTVRIRGRDGHPSSYHLTFGEVVGIYVDATYIVDGRVNTAAMKPIARMGYDEYTVVHEAFRMTRPVLEPLTTDFTPTEPPTPPPST